jgi:hypothetical protein
MKTKNILAAAVMVLFCTEFLQPQSNVGTTLGQFLLIEPSSRISAMGNAGSSITDEPMAAFYNPAAAGHGELIGLQVTHSNWLAGIVYDYAIVHVPFGNGSGMMLNVTSLRSGDIDVRTVDLPLGTGERYSVQNFAFGAGYGMKLTDRVAVGLQATYIQENIWHSSVNLFAINFGTQYQLTDGGVMLGASLSNYGNRNNYTGRDLRIRYDQNKEINGDNSSLPAEYYTEDFGLPILFRVGLSMPFEITEGHQVLLVTDAVHPNNNTESINLGAEYTFSQLFSLRAGYQNVFETDNEQGRLTAGAGLLFETSGVDFKVDYAWTDYEILDSVQRLTVSFAF